MRDQPVIPASGGTPARARVSFWWEEAGGRPVRRPALSGDQTCDVAIVGAGYTGLWTAYYLAGKEPSLRIAILEARHVGFGASGRNGGWLSAQISLPSALLADPAGRDGVVRLRRAMTDSVDEVLSVISTEGIDADAVKSGSLRVAVTPAQEARLRSFIARERGLGATPDDWSVLSPDDVRSRIDVPGVLVGAYTPHCARIQPAKLAIGLAEAVERRGVVIYEDTMAVSTGPGVVATRQGTVRAPVVIRATEGFTARLPGLARSWLPMNSSMIVTDPIPASVWEAIGWRQAETLSDMAHAYVYLQRTADGRIAIGGRGTPYAFGDGFDPAGPTPDRVSESLAGILRRLLPPTAGIGIDRSWSGVLGVPRDWTPGVTYDRPAGLAWAGGYVGQGVTTANLAGRTLADLLTATESELTRLPWVGHVSRRWEPEPLRWLGVRGLYAAYRYADRREERIGKRRSALIARIADRVTGR